MSFWAAVKKDLQKGVKGSMEAIGAGAAKIQIMAAHLTEEGEKRLKVHELKQKVSEEIAELGGHIYELKDKLTPPLSGGKIKTSLEKIRKLEDEIKAIEGKTQKTVKRISGKIKSMAR
jgi:vacuolar-type H+-ATPase subunit I/STV1